ncbi:AAA family ATPase [Pseudooceanicola spongiae]|jgi:DNA transposition AAA+ family ATPase|uniref:AAA family ATPase n=1 Tax=Pseudooceanicola spongiae TaxID=2613965 RepID=A0A7L9WJ78_9RHOB|nr:ATP-binding protein [Pseudooceanicola spongiae]QOL80435.1 AAA family ATPase [Pseudooceanicola spongiae]
MRNTFVETENFRRFVGALKSLDERGAEEACIVIVDGKPGLGKTTTLSRWVVQTGSIYLRAQKGWDYSWFMQELLAELSVDPRSIRGRRDRFERVLQELQDRSERAALEDKVFGIVIDECDMISRRPEIMEAIRGISDLKFLPTVLVGMGKLRDDLRRYPQIESRAPNKIDFRPLSVEDTKILIEGRCEVPVANDLIAFVCRASKGFSREILDAIKSIERFGRRFDIGSDGVTVADMAGQVIMTDRNSGKDIFVPVPK